mmetsp:Transcript_62457/g.99293  ORF Transcript_62457/g.99293 Transcript_62457/m.99293 type:complete len:251 (+) Transcript_62457:30-782(+)|eukprot:CAMPEP_0197024848 /NCGR_PEP_ID=MMETSP1384-20130603/5328_1 /TAXON_ID=29189 /ORGANISM="Ammonia sp." /LENGTH=250 /DNA_ID=CAMNT_0042453305 /DNA_START=16 /DNA_END=768 /DNA_ORIENTATION=+
MTTYSALNVSPTNDPYYTVKLEIQRDVEAFTSDFDEWHDMLENSNTWQNREFKDLTDALKQQYKSINKKLKEVSKTIAAVESDRTNYASISTQELQDRKSFIGDMKTTINDYRGKMQSEKTRDILNQHKREYEQSKVETAQQRFSRIRNDEFIADHSQVQQQEEKQQDEILDDMKQTLKRLGVHANTINVELESQSKLLDEVDEEMDITKDRLTRLTQKLDALMGNSNTKKILLIVILVIILVVLIYFMF